MDKLTFRTLLRRSVLIPFAVAAVLALIFFLEVNYLVKRAGWVDHTDQVIGVAERIYRARIDEETGLRAYLLTHDEHFLQPLRAGREDGRRMEQQLRKLISDNPEQQAREDQALEAYAKWQAFSDDATARAKSGQRASDTDQLRGKDLMDQYRAAQSAFITKEEELRTIREANSRGTVGLVNITIGSLCLVAGIAISVLGRRQLVQLSNAFNTALDKAVASEAAVREQKEWLETTLGSIGDAVIATDANGSITFVNPVAETLTGWTARDAQNAPLASVFKIANEQTREAVENPVDKVRRLNRVVGLANHTILISKNGQESAIDDSGAPIRDPQGKLIGVVLVFRDVTQQRNLERALLSNEKLAIAGRLSASIAHEIHNPLDTVGNLLFMIGQQTKQQPQVQRLMTTAQGEIQRIAQISKGMLSLNREARNPMPVKLSEVLDEVVALIEDTLAKGKRRIRVEHGFQGELQGFPSELRQVFTNVLKNSVEATKEGGNILISSALNRHDGHEGVVVDVTDDGMGIPEHMRSRLFMPFATTKQEGGNGLGLWVSRSILEKHNGTIRITSNGPSGTKVSVFLPLQITAAKT